MEAILAIRGAKGRQISAPITLATIIRSIRLTDRERRVVNISGPGVIPSIRNAPRSIAITELPGMPRAKVVSNAPASLESLALSGAITPSTIPVPNRSGYFEVCLA